MKYLAYARRFRPQRFEEVVGQEGVVSTLRNAIQQDRVAHAYLFCGPRGVGKTTSARILARALNCETTVAGEPCGECGQCRAIVAAESLDVVEMDAASHRGVDDIRNLREGVYNMTHGAKYRVYIIDEVHMLTTEAFNAFLKVLEEPPSHVKFVLCTTDPQRIPETVRSRCQRLDFRRVTVPDAVGRLKQIAATEGLEVDDEALREVALHAQGGLRDAEVLLEQLSVYASGPITPQHVRALTGAVEEKKLASIAADLAASRAGDVFTKADAILEAGTDPCELMDALLEHLRSALAVQACGADSPAIRSRGIDIEAAQGTASALTQGQLLYAAAVIQSARKESKTSMKPRILLELALLKLSRVKDLVTLEELVSDIGSAEPAENAASATATEATSRAATAPTPAPAPALTPAPTPAPSPKLAPAAPRAAERVAPQPTVEDTAAALGEEASPFRNEQEESSPGPEPVTDGLTIDLVNGSWPSVIAAVTEKSAAVGAFLKEGVVAGVKGDVISLGFSARHSFHRESLSAPERQVIVQKTACEIFGRQVVVKFVARRDDSARQKPKPTAERADEIVYKSEGIRKLVEKSGGRIVRIEEPES